MRRWLLVVIALAACGDHHAPTSEMPAAPGAKQLRVLSYNMNFGIAGDPLGVDAVASGNADLVFLQETNAAWEAALVDRLGNTYPNHRFTGPHELPAGGMGVLSKAPILSIDELPTHGGMFFAWRVVLDTAVGRVQVFNFHLRPPMSDGGSWVVGFFSTRKDRLQEVEYHMEAQDHALPTLIVGDFNEEGDGLAVGYLREHGFADAVAELNGGAHTWAWPVGSITLKFQLDHLLHDDHFIAVASKIMPVGRSDHLPVWADFEMDPSSFGR